MEKLDLPLYHSGKVRDTYLLPDHPDLLLVVASDRLSTHNVLHLSEVPGKGELLTALTVFWHLGPLRGIPNHIVAYGFDVLKYVPLGNWPKELTRCGLVVRRLEMIPIEFVWRNRLAGSLYKNYAEGKDPYGIHLRPGLKKMHRFAVEVFTPTDKSATDDPRNHEEVRRMYPGATATTNIAAVFMYHYLHERGIDGIDFKLEAGTLPGDPYKSYLADEFGTGDSSRFARIKDVRVGEDPPWLDKQVFREEAERIWGGTSGPPLIFSAHVVKQGVQKYHEAFEAIAETTLGGFQSKHMEDPIKSVRNSVI